MQYQPLFDSIVVMIIFILVFLGLVWGSFVNAWVWRLHEQLDADGNPKKLSKAKKRAVAVTTGRSMCPQCKHILATKDLVPVFSWLWLRGKCRYCHKPISPQYPAVELLVAILFATSYIFWPVELSGAWNIVEFVTWLVALVGLVALAIYDIRWMLLPDKIIYPLIAICAGSLLTQFVLGRPLSDIWQILLTISITAGIFWLIYQVSSGKWVGGGDVKLGVVAGLLLIYPMNGFLYLFFASIIGILCLTPKIIAKKVSRTQQVPFGPFLIASLFVVMLWGQAMVEIYTKGLDKLVGL